MGLEVQVMGNFGRNLALRNMLTSQLRTDTYNSTLVGLATKVRAWGLQNPHRSLRSNSLGVSRYLPLARAGRKRK